MMAVGKIMALFILSAIVFNGIGTAGLFRAVKSSGKVFQKPLQNSSDLSLLPNLLRRMSGEWRTNRPLITFRSGGRHRIMDFCCRLKAVFWHGQTWPDDLKVAHTFRVGPTQHSGKVSGNRAGWKDIVLLAGSVSCLALSGFSLRF